jgi:hypothetical protein
MVGEDEHPATMIALKLVLAAFEYLVVVPPDVIIGDRALANWAFVLDSAKIAAPVVAMADESDFSTWKSGVAHELVPPIVVSARAEST